MSIPFFQILSRWSGFQMIICYYWKKWPQPPQRPVPCKRMLASRTGTRLSSVRPDKLCSQSYLNAQIQLRRHTNGQCTCYY